LSNLPIGIVPLFPQRSYIKYTHHSQTCDFSRLQIPIVPAYAYTDYKSQGRSLQHAIVDLASSRSLQSLYVMLSRVKSLSGLAILRWFPPGKISQPLSHKFQDEFTRLQDINEYTTKTYIAKNIGNVFFNKECLLMLAVDVFIDVSQKVTP
jgi:hypothetical protein